MAPFQLANTVILPPCRETANAGGVAGVPFQTKRYAR